MTWQPSFNTAPISWYARRILDFINSQQTEAIAWWNDAWSSVVDHTLIAVDPLSMHVGAPIDLHARGLYAIPSETTSEFDNYDERTITILIAYTTGNVAFEGGGDPAHAQQFAATEVSGFYLEMFRSILQKMTREDLISGWPEIPRSEPPGIRLRIDQTRPKDGGLLRSTPEQGEELLIQVTLVEDANPIWNPPSS